MFVNTLDCLRNKSDSVLAGLPTKIPSPVWKKISIRNQLPLNDGEYRNLRACFKAKPTYSFVAKCDRFV